MSFPDLEYRTTPVRESDADLLLLALPPLDAEESPDLTDWPGLRDALLGVGCVPPPAQPTVEIYDVPVAWMQQWTERFPTGTAVRFVLNGDVVDVWIYEGTS